MIYSRDFADSAARDLANKGFFITHRKVPSPKNVLARAKISQPKPKSQKTMQTKVLYYVFAFYHKDVVA